jgi:hypothetical protein
MSWLRKEKTLEIGTERWKKLHKYLKCFAGDIWGYVVLIDDKYQDLQKIRTKIDAIENDLRLAEKTWPEGKSIIKRMRHWVVLMIQARNDEQRLVEWSNAHPQQWNSKNYEKQRRENLLWLQANNEMKKKLDLSFEGILECSDEIKNWTSINSRVWLEGKEH